MAQISRIGWRTAALLLVLVMMTSPAMPATGEGDSADQSLAVVDLRTDRRSTPLGIDAAAPRLSWELVSPRRGVTQASYRVRVATTAAGLEGGGADVWDSGVVAADDSINVIYEGPPLESRRRYWWTVTVVDDSGASATAEPTWWEMGLLDPSDWSAGWVGAIPKNGDTEYLDALLRSGGYLGYAGYVANAPWHTGTAQSADVYTDAATAQPIPYLRREFAVSGEVASARLYASALGVYELRLNGERVSEDLLAPGWTEYTQRVQYQTYDVTHQLREGANAIGGLLGLGWYAGHRGFAGPYGYGETPALLAQLEITYADGSTEVIGTDGSWGASFGPVTYSDMLMGERHDARLEQDGWDEPGFLPGAAWPPVLVEGSVADVGKRLVAHTDPPVRVLAELPAIARTEPEPGTWIFDLGQNFAGVVRLKAEGPAGTTVTLRHGEVLNPDGTLYVENLRGAKATDTYTLAGGGEEVWQPKFTFHGFRYVEVTGYPGVPELDAVTGLAIGNSTPVVGSFETSDPQLNQLYSNITWGQRSNFLSVPTDTPARDERGGWTGDGQIFARTAALNTDVSGFYTKWLRDVNDAQGGNGAYSDTAPRLPGVGEGVAGWADAGIVVPWQMYLAYGDTGVIDEHWDGMVEFVEYMRNGSNGLIRPAGGYGDWLNLGDHTPTEMIATAYFASSTRLLAQMADVTGRTDAAAEYHQLADDITTAFQGAFLNDDGTTTADSQTSYVLALSMDLMPTHLRQAAADRLVELIRGRDMHLSTGFLGTRDLMHVLTDTGHVDIAYALINQRTFPSWRYMIDKGATTMWEHWDSIRPDGSFQRVSMNSFNHYAYGAVGEWMYRRIAGLDSDASDPGYGHITFAPQPGGGLTYARASHDSPHGLVESGWAVEGEDRLRVDVTVPANATATLHVPAISSVTEDGVELVGGGGDGITFVSLAEGTATFELGSGTYSLVTDATIPDDTAGGGTDPEPEDPSLDHADVGSATSEAAHGLSAGPTSGTGSEAGATRRYTGHRVPLGWFELDMAIEPGEPFTLRLAETYDGNPGIRDYDVLIDGVTVHRRSQQNPSGAAILTYDLRIDDAQFLEDGTVRVRIQEDELGQNYDASIADIWTLPVE